MNVVTGRITVRYQPLGTDRGRKCLVAAHLLSSVAMKHDELRSIAHNIANSLASGCGLMIGMYELDVFGEAARSEAGFIRVDFLNGSSSGGEPTQALAEAISRYSAALPDLCRLHRADVSDFRVLAACYSGPWRQAQFIVETMDRIGRTFHDRYVGVPGARPRAVDALGRVRCVKSA